jgi:hypothetical protein
MDRKNLGAVAAAVCGIVFLASLCFPVFYFPEETYLVGGKRAASTIAGWEVLLWGWNGMVRYSSPPLFQGHAAWLANPCFFLVLVLLLAQRYRAALIGGAVTIAIALTSLRLTHTWIDLGSERTLLGYGSGYYLWLSAMGSSFVAPVVLLVLTRSARRARGEGDIQGFRADQAAAADGGRDPGS